MQNLKIKPLIIDGVECYTRTTVSKILGISRQRIDVKLRHQNHFPKAFVNPYSKRTEILIPVSDLIKDLKRQNIDPKLFLYTH